MRLLLMGGTNFNAGEDVGWELEARRLAVRGRLYGQVQQGGGELRKDLRNIRDA
jgi:hypothetical protein